jgi:hypothetical protein
VPAPRRPARAGGGAARGLAAVNEFRGRYHVSEEILEQLLGAGDSPLAVEAHELLACSTFHQGRAATAVRYAEAGLALYDEDRDSGFLAPYGEHRPSPATTGRPWPCGSWATPTAPWPTPPAPWPWPASTPTAWPPPRSS